jgi:PhnB protein
VYDPVSGYPGAVVELAYQDVAHSLEWLEQVFGLRPVLWQPASGDLAHAEVETEFGGVVMLRKASGGAPAPCRSSACKQVLVWVSNVDEHHARVAVRGAHVVQAPVTKPFGLRQYLVRDCEGHLWEFSQHVRDVPPAEWGAVTPAGRSTGVDKVVDDLRQGS